ncbi:hypothetical protein AB0I53_40585 [Saccharopolyspora sp. NPDC050389]|uniref:hypothetical protein n=1 Tax=Saccharopolyspora sp. NPDC050389 TaxID=3155516 RepID=UPI0033E43376
MATIDLPEDVEHVLRQLESEMADTREYILRCRALGDEQAAQLHVIWIDLLLDEWSRCRLVAQEC